MFLLEVVVPLGVDPVDSRRFAVGLSPVAFAAHGLQVAEVVVWFTLGACGVDVVDCPVGT